MCFLQNQRFLQRYENYRFGAHFSRPKPRDFQGKFGSKNAMFSKIVFNAFYFDVGHNLASKNRLKINIFRKNDVRRRPLKHYVFTIAFRTEVEVLRVRFRLIFEPPGTIFVAPA